MYNDDLRWVANVALGCAFILIFGGVILSGYLDEGREYTLIMFGILALMFATVGGCIHYKAWSDDKRRTITRNLDGWK